MHTHSQVGLLEVPGRGGRGGSQNLVLKKLLYNRGMRGGGVCQTKNPSRGGVGIYPGTTHLNKYPHPREKEEKCYTPLLTLEHLASVEHYLELKKLCLVTSSFCLFSRC